MAKLFKRAWTVTVEGKQTTDLRVVFHVKKTLKKEPNTLDLKIFNLSAASRGLMRSKGASVLVSAGYEENQALIFSGDSRSIDHTHDGPDWVTHVQCGDGERAYQFNRASMTFDAGAKAADVIEQVGKAFVSNLGNLPKVLKGDLKVKEFVSGFTAHGTASKVFDDLMRTQGFEWSVQDGALQVREPDKAGAQEVFQLSSTSGLIGSPDHTTPQDEKKPSVLKVKSFLIPQIVCGGLVNIQSRSLNGTFLVTAVEHEGDSHGAAWYTNLEIQTPKP